ncbi:hypothetical protein SPBR_09146 [Sporothrix brasiliensis 5110]|uniref:HTH CENPB-type domain-containing protein n=1 Tax=Sporothrix brasiliensis 5110 TaxID=1398154 RepID=A0A0C2F2P3_9PEZI|nr:uncharacterized protein SPBR_09146 [Sporothrix brasiliensis 5110]KIH93134.1 hypothetical protein SPBR_09146 [Sporothrix brasiliensis 5110]
MSASFATSVSHNIVCRRQRDYTEDDVKRALLAIENGASVRQAAKQNKVPFSTLKSRRNGALPASDAFESHQKLSREQEKHLCGWIIVQGMIGRRPTHADIRAMAASIVDPTGQTESIGKRWMSGFMRRNPSMKMARAKS